MKNGDYYEPIYAYRTEGNKKKITKTFSEYDLKLSNSMREVFNKLIKPIINNTCIPLSSKPNIYTFKRPLLLYNLIEQVNKLGYDVVKQIVNYQGKVISILVSSPSPKNQKGILPCYPSSIDITYDYVFMTDESVYDTYSNTIAFLTSIYETSKHKIPCKPEFKVIEDEMIVGILTSTNQFVQLSVPLPISEINDDIKIFRTGNYLSVDKKILMSNDVDEERIDDWRKTGWQERPSESIPGLIKRLK